MSGTPDPHHVLVLLGAGWPSGVHNAGLNADALIAQMARRGMFAHRALDRAEAEAALRDWPIGAAILDTQAPAPDLYPTYERLRSVEPSLPCVLLGPPQYRDASWRPSALDCLDEFVRVDDACTVEGILLYLRAVLLRAYPELRRDDPGPAAPPAKRSELVCVCSAKGGAGKTTIACNLAVGLAHERGKRVALVDGDLYFGDVDVSLGLRASVTTPRLSLHTVVEAIRIPMGPWNQRCEEALAGFDQKLLDDVLYEHSSGAHVLPSPTRPEMAERIPPQVYQRAVELCRRKFEYTIVDVPSPYSEVEIQLLDWATTIIVVLKPEMSCLRNTVLFLDYAVQFGWGDKLLLVLNRADSNRFTQISREAVERHLGRPVVPVLSSGAIPRAASEGRAILEAAASSKVAASLRVLVDQVAGPSGQPTTQRQGLRRLLPGILSARRRVDVAGA